MSPVNRPTQALNIPRAKTNPARSPRSRLNPIQATGFTPVMDGGGIKVEQLRHRSNTIAPIGALRLAHGGGPLRRARRNTIRVAQTANPCWSQRKPMRIGPALLAE